MVLKKIARILIILFVVLFVILFSAQLYINYYLKNKLAGHLQEQVDIATKHQYNLKIGATNVSIFNRSIDFDDIEFVPKPCNGCKVARYKIIAKNISLDGIGLMNFIKRKSISATSLSFTDIAINIYQSKTRPVKTDTSNVRLSLYKIISKKVNELAIENIRISNTKLKLFKNDSTEVLFSDENDIYISKFLVNSRIDSLERLFVADKFNFNMKTFSYVLPDKLYTIKGKNLTASYADSLVSVDSLELVPNFNKDKFSDVAGKQVSRVKLNSAGVVFSKMNVQLFLEHNWFLAKKLDINALNLNVYRDKNPDFKPVKSISVQEVIRKIPFLIIIDTVKVNNSDIIYEHLAKGTKQAGKIYFNNLNGTITGLRNDSNSYTDNKAKLKLRARAKFMNKGKLTVLYEFPLNTVKEVFHCSGKLVNMDMKELNMMLENTVFASIESGRLDTMAFSFNANDQRSKGWMKFLYHDLKVQLINRDDKKQTLKKKILSFLADKFIINDSNPQKGKAPLITDIAYERYPYKFLFYYTWKSLQTGILPALGVKHSEKFINKSDDK